MITNMKINFQNEILNSKYEFKNSYLKDDQPSKRTPFSKI